MIWHILTFVLGAAYIAECVLFRLQSRYAKRACDGWIDALKQHQATLDALEEAQSGE